MSQFTKSQAREIARYEILTWHTEQPAEWSDGFTYTHAVQQLARKISYLVEADVKWEPILDVLRDLTELDDLDQQVGRYQYPHDHTTALDNLETELESDLTWVIEAPGTWTYQPETAVAA